MPLRASLLLAAFVVAGGAAFPLAAGDAACIGNAQLGACACWPFDPPAPGLPRCGDEEPFCYRAAPFARGCVCSPLPLPRPVDGLTCHQVQASR
jgi:hypothetical protein